jgi:hypothetical protein
MFEAEKARQAEQKEKKMQEARSGGGGGRTPNSMNSQTPPASSGHSQSETVRYISDGETTADGDEDTLSVI